MRESEVTRWARALLVTVAASCSPLGLFDGSDPGDGAWDPDEARARLNTHVVVDAGYRVDTTQCRRFLAQRSHY